MKRVIKVFVDGKQVEEVQQIPNFGYAAFCMVLPKYSHLSLERVEFGNELLVLRFEDHRLHLRRG